MRKSIWDKLLLLSFIACAPLLGTTNKLTCGIAYSHMKGVLESPKDLVYKTTKKIDLKVVGRSFGSFKFENGDVKYKLVVTPGGYLNTTLADKIRGIEVRQLGLKLDEAATEMWLDGEEAKHNGELYTFMGIICTLDGATQRHLIR